MMACLVVFDPSSTHQTKKKVVRVGPPLAKLSGSAYEYGLIFLLFSVASICCRYALIGKVSKRNCFHCKIRNLYPFLIENMP